MHKKFSPENVKGRVVSEDVGIDWRIILEWISKKYIESMLTGFNWLRIEISGGLF